MLRRILASTRYLIILPVIGSFIISVVMLIYSAFAVGDLVLKTLQTEVGSKAAKVLSLTAIEIIDLFLLSIAFYIIALGLYELFIDDQIELPVWLEIKSFDDLKSKLVSVLIVVMGVLFLGQAVTWDGQRDLLGFGLSLAAVMGVLSFFYTQKKKE